MKIAHIICTFPPYRGGMGNSAWQFANALTKFQHDITVFTPLYQRTGQQGFQNTNPKIKIVRLKPWLVVGNAAVVPQLFWQLAQFDVLHLHYPFYGAAEIVWLWKLLQGSRCKLILHYHMDNQAAGLKGLIFRWHRRLVLPLILRQADEITCASLDYIKHSKIGPYYKKHLEKFSQVPFGVDLEKFHPAVQTNTASSEQTPRILFVGGLDTAHYFKGIDNLLHAWQQLNLKPNQAKLRIVGQGDLESHYRQTAQELNIADQVEFMTNADDCQLADCYLQARALVLPSINQSEAFGLVLLEAMASGKPVIASNLPGVRSVFRNNEQGLLVKPGDIADLAEKIKRLLTNDRLADKMGQAARELVVEQYTWDKAAAKLNEIYYRVKNAPHSKNILLKQ